MYNNFPAVFLLFWVIELQAQVIHTLLTCVFVGNQFIPNFIYTMLIMCKVNKFFANRPHDYV